MRRVVILRPGPGASATLAKAQAAGLEAVAVPLFAIEPLAWDLPDPGLFDGLLLTSANAIRFGGDGLRRLRALKVYAVGDATAQAAREAGFEIAGTGDRGIDRLLESIDPRLRLLHPCGMHRRDPPQGGRRITHLPVYRAMPVERPDLARAKGSVALVHSPRAGKRLAELVQDRGSIAIAAISPAAAKSAGTGWHAIDVAAEPTDDALLALASRLCNNSAPK